MVEILLGLFFLWLRNQLQCTQQQTAKSIEKKYEDSKEISKNTSAIHHGISNQWQNLYACKKIMRVQEYRVFGTDSKRQGVQTWTQEGSQDTTNAHQQLKMSTTAEKKEGTKTHMRTPIQHANPSIRHAWWSMRKITVKGVLIRFEDIAKGMFFISLVCSVNTLHTPESDNTYKIFNFDFEIFVAAASASQLHCNGHYPDKSRQFLSL
uniref:Putative secreted peptide n=1 Tax=Rhipicephalus pulchellus TaxID=72859 RepID=L7M9D6_RHIPC